jgi:uncharacterized membrane protein
VRRTILVTAALALTALAALGLTAAGQTSTDLATTDVDPGEPVVDARRTVNATVENVGEDPVVDFEVTFYWQDTDQPVNGTEADSSTAYTRAPLNPGESARLSYDWEPDREEAGSGHLVAVVSHDGDGNPDNDRGEQATFVTRPGVAVDETWDADPITIEPGEPRSLAFHVTNEGNRNATMEAELTTPADRDDWTFSVSPDASRLLPGEQARFVLTVEAPEDAPAGQAANATNGLDLAVHQREDRDSALAHARPTVPDLQVAAQRELAAQVEAPDPREPGEPASATITIANEGNTEENVTLERATTSNATTDDWPITFSRSSLTIPAGDAAETTVEIAIPDDAPAGEHPLAIVATGEDPTPPVARTEIGVEVRQIHRVDAQTPDGDLELLPDQPGSVQVLVNNTGNGADEITVDAEAPSSSWDVQASPDQLDLAAGEQATVEVAIQPPAGHDPETGIAVPITAQAGEDAQAQVEARVTVTEGAYIHLEDLPESLTARADSGATIDAVLANGGNREGNASLALDAADDWEVSADLDEAQLAAGASESVRLTVATPEGAAPGEEATIEAETRNQPGGPNVPDSTLVSVGGPDWSAHLGSLPDQVATGETIPVPVEVASQGLEEAPATQVELVALGEPGQETIATFEAASTEPGEQRSFEAAWNTSGWAGEVRFTATVDTGDEIAEESETNNEAEASLAVTFVELALEAPGPRTVDAGAPVRVGQAEPITVTNQGNRPASVELRVHDEAGWVDHEETLTVDAGQRQPVDLAFTVPRPAGTLDDTVTIEAHADGAQANATWPLTVRDPAPPEVTGLDPEPAPEWGQATNVTIRWDDATGLTGGRVLVEDPEGGSQEIDVQVDDGRAWFAWTPETVGTHEIVPVLEDRAGNSVPGFPREIDVAEPPAVAATLDADEPTRPGALVPVDSTGRVPFAEVVVERDGVNRTLTDPYRIDTTGWAEATHTVAIRTEDALGRENATTATIEIDATPPELVDLTLDPEDPDAGDEVTARLTFDEPVADAWLRLETAEGTERIETEAVSEDERRAQFTAPTGDASTIDVEVRDRAGNEAVVTASREIGGDQGIPAPGPALLLATVAGLAAARARH